MAKGRFFTGQQVAQRLGISKQTLFRYEKKGVFPKPPRSVINRWRQYTEDDIKRLQDIIKKSIRHG
ncbi:MAG: MerR family transcriptional regulator [Candidatus Omnitrophota bacterium]